MTTDDPATDFPVQFLVRSINRHVAMCDDGWSYLRALRPTSTGDAWARCARADWMLYGARVYAIELDRRTVAAFAVECSERALPALAGFTPPGWSSEQFRQMVDKTRRWVAGETVEMQNVVTEADDLLRGALTSVLYLALSSPYYAHLAAADATAGRGNVPYRYLRYAQLAACGATYAASDRMAEERWQADRLRELLELP